MYDKTKPYNNFSLSVNTTLSGMSDVKLTINLYTILIVVIEEKTNIKR